MGTNTVRLTSNGFSGANIDYLEVRVPDPNVVVIQAEDLVSPMVNDPNLSRAVDPALMAARNIAGTNDTFRVGAEGESYLDWGAAGATVDFSFDAPAAGTYQITFTYANGATTPNAGARPLELVNLDNNEVTVVAFASTANAVNKPPRMPTDITDIDATPGGTGAAQEDTNVPALTALPTGWETWSRETITIHLDEGQNTLRLRTPAGAVTGPNIDKIVVALVDPDNSAPEADAFAVAATEDTAIVIDVASHIDDIDGDALTVTASVPVVQGTVTVDGTEITFMPAANFHGDATISYTVMDPSGLISTADITVTVEFVNDAPAIAGTLDDAAVPADGGSIDLSVLTKADADGDATTFGVRLAGGGELPAGITISGNAIEVAASVPAGAYELEIFATDGGAQSPAIPFTLTKSEAEEEPEPFVPFILQAESETVVDVITPTPRPTTIPRSATRATRRRPRRPSCLSMGCARDTPEPAMSISALVQTRSATR